MVFCVEARGERYLMVAGQVAEARANILRFSETSGKVIAMIKAENKHTSFTNLGMPFLVRLTEDKFQFTTNPNLAMNLWAELSS